MRLLLCVILAGLAWNLFQNIVIETFLASVGLLN